MGWSHLETNHWAHSGVIIDVELESANRMVTLVEAWMLKSMWDKVKS